MVFVSLLNKTKVTQNKKQVKLIIHDLKGDDADIPILSASKDIQVISDNGEIKPCIGCFGCWLKTPGECIINNDGYNHIGRMFGHCDDIWVISKCFYGTYSPFVKNVLDRSLGFLLPFFKTINGEMHHKIRYDNKISMKVFLYGDILEYEKQTAENILNHNSVNYDFNKHEVLFFKNVEELKRALL